MSLGKVESDLEICPLETEARSPVWVKKDRIKNKTKQRSFHMQLSVILYVETLWFCICLKWVLSTGIH